MELSQSHNQVLCMTTAGIKRTRDGKKIHSVPWIIKNASDSYHEPFLYRTLIALFHRVKRSTIFTFTYEVQVLNGNIAMQVDECWCWCWCNRQKWADAKEERQKNHIKKLKLAAKLKSAQLGSAQIKRKHKTCTAIRNKKPQQNFNEDLHKY